MSFGIAVRNGEGVVLAADTLCYSGGSAQIHTKLQWMRGFRAAYLMLPIFVPRSDAVDPDRNGSNSQRELVSKLGDLYAKSIDVHRDHQNEYEFHEAWTLPEMTVIAATDRGPTVIHVLNGEPTNITRMQEAVGLNQREPIAVIPIGGWRELADAEGRFRGIPWRKATDIRSAKAMVRDAMLEAIADATRVGPRDGAMRRIGGPVDVAVITDTDMTMERFQEVGVR